VMGPSASGSKREVMIFSLLLKFDVMLP
jgi:hypothetical protein